MYSEQTLSMAAYPTRRSCGAWTWPSLRGSVANWTTSWRICL